MIIRFSLSAICVILVFALVTAAAQKSATPPEHVLSDLKQTCPIISVSCPADVENGKPLTFTANVSGGNPNVVPIYDWSVSVGKIVHGQGSSSIRVDPMGYGGHSFTATVSVAGFDLTCAKTASCSLIIEHFPPSIKFDSFGTLPRNKEIARLNAFAVELQNQPGTQGYLLVYGGRRGGAGKSQKAVGRAKEYLVNRRGIDAGRIVTVDAGFKEEVTIDLWLVPSGAAPPRPEPTLDPTEVKIIRKG